MSKIDYQALREAAWLVTQGEWIAFASSSTSTYVVYIPGDRQYEDVIKWTGFDEQNNVENNVRYVAVFNPEAAQVSPDGRERNQQYIKCRDQEDEDIALTAGKPRVELEKAKLKLNEQRECYEGVISDGGKHTAELGKQYAERERRALSNREECVTMTEHIEEMQTKSAPDSFGIIGENIRIQDNQTTSDPMLCMYQKRETVVDADYDHDRIVWIDENNNKTSRRHSRCLELLHENFQEPPEKWRCVTVKDIDEFVICCFTEQDCKDYLIVNSHNLRLPFIHVRDGFRNAKYIGTRNWLASIRIRGE